MSLEQIEVRATRTSSSSLQDHAVSVKFSFNNTHFMILLWIPPKHAFTGRESYIGGIVKRVQDARLTEVVPKALLMGRVLPSEKAPFVSKISSAVLRALDAPEAVKQDSPTAIYDWEVPYDWESWGEDELKGLEKSYMWVTEYQTEWERRATKELRKDMGRVLEDSIDAFEVRHENRRAGRTTKLLTEAPEGAFFICGAGYHHIKRLALSLGRSDLHIKEARDIHKALVGIDQFNVVLDHALTLPERDHVFKQVRMGRRSPVVFPANPVRDPFELTKVRLSSLKDDGFPVFVDPAGYTCEDPEDEDEPFSNDDEDVEKCEPEEEEGFSSCEGPEYNPL